MPNNLGLSKSLHMVPLFLELSCLSSMFFRIILSRNQHWCFWMCFGDIYWKYLRNVFIYGEYIIGGPKMVVFCHGCFWNKYKIYPNNENYHFGTMRKTTILGPGSEVPGQPPGPRMVVLRMVPKWSFSLFGYILYLFQKQPWQKTTILGPPKLYKMEM